MAENGNERTLELWASQEVCAALKWNRTYLARARAKDFPEPIAVVAGGTIAVWNAQDVRDWHLQHVDARRIREWRQGEALRVYRQTGRIADAARAVQAKPETIRTWFRALGEQLPSERKAETPS